MAKSKTAVEWLKEQYNKRGGALPSGVFQEAREMEKRQKFDEFVKGIILSNKEDKEDLQEYYDKTYGNGQRRTKKATRRNDGRRRERRTL